MYEVDKGKKIMDNILIALTRKHKFVWHEIHKAIETYEPISNEEVKKLSAIDTDKTTIISPFYPKYLMKAFNPPFVLFHSGNYDLIDNKMIGIVGKIDESKIEVWKFLASNQYVMNFKLSSMNDNDLELLQKNKIPSIVFCKDIMDVKKEEKYQKYLNKDNFLFLSEAYEMKYELKKGYKIHQPLENYINRAFGKYYINRIFVGHDLPVIVFDKSINNDLALMGYLSETKHKVYLYTKQHIKPEYDQYIGAKKLNNLGELKNELFPRREIQN